MSGNSFLTPSAVARDAAIALRNRLVCANLVSRKVEGVFTAAKVGDSVKVTVPPAVTDADEFAGATVAADLAQGDVDVQLQKHFYKRADLTTKQRTLELDDFTANVTVPFITGIGASIDKYLIAKMRGGFARNVAGTVTNRPSTAAHILAGQKVLNDAFIPRAGRVGLVDTTVENSFLQLTQFASRDYGDQNAGQLHDLMLGKKLGALWVPDPHSDAFARGDIAGTVTASGSATASTLALAALTEATGTIKEGTAFTVAGDTQRYVVTKDTDIVGHAVAALPVYPALKTSPSTALVTFEGTTYSNLIYHPNAVVAAIVAPEPLFGGNSAVASFDGLAVRVSFDSSIVSLASSVVYDVFVGGRVVQHAGGVVLAG
jgi:hypothetical protein